MKRLKAAGIILSGLLFLALCLAPHAGAAEAGKKMPGMASAMLAWRISSAKVVNAGSTRQLDQGILTEGLTIEASAKGIGPSTPVAKGKFRLDITAFSPYQDMPGQRAGKWYVRGNWTIVDDISPRKAEKSRHSPYLVSGFLSAELGFNPAVSAGLVDAVVRLPMAPQGGRWSSGEGTFQGNEKFEGTFQIDATVWPDVMSRR